MAATCCCRSVRAVPTRRSTRCVTSPSTLVVGCRSCGAWTASSRPHGPRASRATTSASWTGSPTRTSPIRTVGNRLLWVGPGLGEPDWAVGGSYHVCRIIRMLIEFWDRVSLNEQQTMIGRYRASGNALGTSSLTAVPDFAADPKGKTIPLTAHIRLANPRTREHRGQPHLPPRLQLRQRLRPGRQPQHGIDLQLLPAEPRAPVHRQPDQADRRADGRLHLARSAAGTSSPCPACATAATGTRAAYSSECSAQCPTSTAPAVAEPPIARISLTEAHPGGGIGWP